MQPIDIAWQLLKNQDYESAANLQRLVPSMETPPQGPQSGEEQFDLQTNNPGVRPSQTDEQRRDKQMVSREKRSLQQMRAQPKLDARVQRRQELGRN